MRWVCFLVFAGLAGLSAACAEDALTRVREDAGRPEDPSVLLDSGGGPVMMPEQHDATVTPPNDDAGMVEPPDAGTEVVDAGVDAGTPDAEMEETPDAGEPEPPHECYTEPFDPTVDISDLEANFFNAPAFDAVLTALQRRYPGCYDLLTGQPNDPYIGTFTDGNSFSDAMASAMTECHEATHGWDYAHALFYQHFDYWIRGDLQHSLTFTVDGFARSEIYGDTDQTTDLYNDLYLTGDQGTRGFLELLDETNCYINGLGGIAAIGDHVNFGISGRDGAVAFLYYVELYLRRARTQDPTLYAAMQADAALKEHLKIQWLRTNFYLMYADMQPHIGIDDAAIRANLYATNNLAEVAMVIGHCIDTTNCLCD